MSRIIAFVLLSFSLIAANAFALSEAEWQKLKSTSTIFRLSEQELTKTWNEKYKNLPDSPQKKAMLEDQRNWLKTGRDASARSYMQQGMEYAQAYTQATFDRVGFLKGYSTNKNPTFAPKSSAKQEPAIEDMPFGQAAEASMRQPTSQQPKPSFQQPQPMQASPAVQQPQQSDDRGQVKEHDFNYYFSDNWKGAFPKSTPKKNDDDDDLPANVHVLSDAEWQELKNSDFTLKMAEQEMNQAFNEKYNSLPSSQQKEALLEDQKNWMKRGRDARAQVYMEKGQPRMGAYLYTLIDRKFYLQQYGIKKDDPGEDIFEKARRNGDGMIRLYDLK